MPLFDYRCAACDHAFEHLALGSERPACPACGSRKLERQPSVFAVGGGASPRAATTRPAPAPCGSCGDPGGAGSCAR